MRWSSFKYLVKQGLHSMVANRMMTFASIAVLTICLVITGLAYLFGVNVNSVVDYLGQQNETVVYLKVDLTDEQIARVDTAIRSMSGISSVTYVSKADVLETYRGYMDEYADLWDTFENDNPFKANYRVVVEDLDQMEAMTAQLQSIEGVDKVSAPLELSGVFVSVQKVIVIASYVLVAVLGLVAVVVISNTIRLTVFSRRKEINIMKYVGATNGFIRFPFFVEGLASGLLSALLASGIVLGAYYALIYYAAELPSFWGTILSQSIVPMSKVWYYIVGGFAGFAFLLGGVGTATSIRKHLNV